MKQARSFLLTSFLVLALLIGRGSGTVRVPGMRPSGTPPPKAAARFTPGSGTCILTLSVFVPAQGGEYPLGISFSYRDMNHDGSYTPGVDKLDVCVNCSDACDWGP